jgi:hypothetical protein
MTILPLTFQQFTCRQFTAKPAARIPALLIAGLSLIFSSVFDRAAGADIHALNCTLPAVQTAVAAASPGDTVWVPPGAAIWTGTLTINNDIQLIGAGIGQTIITNGVVGTLISWTTASGGSCRFSGFDIEAGPPDAQSSWGTTRLMSIGGACHAFRMDNCLFNKINEYNLWFSGWVYGVIDHCAFNAAYSLIEVQMQNYGGQQYGDGSWADGDNWGTTNALYIEACNFTGPTGLHLGMLDGVDGERVVVRYCNSTNCPIGSHGTDSTGRERSVRSYEIYNNNFVYQTNGWPAWNWMTLLRGGTALIWSNSITGGYQSIIGLMDYRYIPIPWSPFGQVTGVNPWDDNNPALLDSGTATATGNSLVDSTKNWAPNQWVSSTANYVLYDATQGYGAAITGNTANTINISGSFQEYSGNNPTGALVITNGDSYQIRQVYATLDQCGYGGGDLLTGSTPVNTTTGTASWPHEAPDPVYIWGNNLNFTLPPGSYPTATISGPASDCVIGVPKPGYVPLVYPHPLDTGSSSSSTNGTSVISTSGGSSSTNGSGTTTNTGVVPPTNLQAHPPQ